MKKPLSQLTKEEFYTLKSMGVLHDVYPEAGDSWELTQKHSSIVSILKKVLASADNYDIINLKKLARQWLETYDEN
jgi:hypothetical protein